MPILFFLAFLLPVSCKKPVVQARTEIALGTVCTINAYEDGTEDLYDACFARLAELETVFSARLPDSELSRVNDAAGKEPVPVSDDFLFVMNEALRIAAASNGAFDPTIGPLVKLWGIGTEAARVPSQAEIDAACNLIDWHAVVVSVADTGEKFPDVIQTDTAGTVFLSKPGMALDLGGIAKGYAADEVVQLLREAGVRRAIIDLGGNVYVLGTRNGSSVLSTENLWRVGIKNPFAPETGAAIRVNCSNQTIVTSGAYERYFEYEGKRYHHLLNPKTGYPAESGIVSCTIVGSSSMTADALSTATFVSGMDGLKLVEKEGMKGICISGEKQVVGTADMQAFIILADDFTVKP